MMTKKYWAYWKRGWWAWLMQICVAIPLGLAFAPLAIFFKDDKVAYSSALAIAFLLVGMPFMGWVFERFAKGSLRLYKAPRSDLTAEA